MTISEVLQALDRLGITVKEGTVTSYVSVGLAPAPKIVRNPTGRGSRGDWPEEAVAEFAASYLLVRQPASEVPVFLRGGQSEQPDASIKVKPTRERVKEVREFSLRALRGKMGFCELRSGICYFGGVFGQWVRFWIETREGVLRGGNLKGVLKARFVVKCECGATVIGEDDHPMEYGHMICRVCDRIALIEKQVVTVTFCVQHA